MSDDFWNYKDPDNRQSSESEESDESGESKVDLDDLDNDFNPEDYRMDDEDEVDAGDEGDEDEPKEKKTLDEEDESGDAKPDEEEKEPLTEDGLDNYAKIRDDIINIVGEDTILKVKGEKVRAGDLTPQEAVKFLQQGIRADQIYNELADARAEVSYQREMVERGADTVQRLLNKYGAGPDAQGQMQPEVPDVLKVGPYDSDETKTLKAIATQLVGEVQSLKMGQEDMQYAQMERAVMNEIHTLHKEYPAASIDEAVAIKNLRPDIAVEDILEASHRYYTSPDFIDLALESNPTYYRKLEQDIIKKYNLSKQKATKVDRVRQRSSGSVKVSTKEKPKIRSFDDADRLARDYIREVERMGDE